MPSPSPLLYMHNLFFILLSISTIINQSNSARNLDHKHNNNNPHNHHQQISFSMLHTLSQTHPTYTPNNGQNNNNINNLPFAKPLGYFPPIGGIPLTNTPLTRAEPRTLELSGLAMSFPASVTLQELELARVTTISEDICVGPVFAGKADGVYVADPEGGTTGHMMAMTARFLGNGDDKYEDSLRLFGLLNKNNDDARESHLVVIGGTGKYLSANGYAIVKTHNVSSISSRSSLENHEDYHGSYKILHFNVYLG